MPMSEARLSSREAYLAMFEFLRHHDERGPTDVIGGLLGSLSLLPDGGTADPAAWLDWQKAVETVLSAERSGRGYDEADWHLT